MWMHGNPPTPPPQRKLRSDAPTLEQKILSISRKPPKKEKKNQNLKTAKLAVILDERTVNESRVSLLLISLTFPSLKAHFLKVQAGSDGWLDIRLIASYLE